MEEIDDQSVDLVVTSPPYNAGKKYESRLSFEEYRRFANAWVSHIRRIIKPSGSFWLNLGYMKLGRNQTYPLTYMYYDLVGMPMVQEVVWNYGGGMSYKLRFTHRTERWQWYSNDPDGVVFNLDVVRDIQGTKFINDKRNNPLGKNPTDCWYFKRVVGGSGKSKEKTKHPCQFPESMIERIVKACSNPGDLVFDPFSGSGTTAVVSARLGRHYLGFEMDREYYVESLARISRNSRL